MTLAVNKIFQGEVAAVHNYGAFIRIPGMGRTQGLVHKSQISSSRVDDAAEILELNEKVWCKIISISEDNKIGLSMKVVDQGSGRDLDPNGVQLSLDAQQRKERGGHRDSSAIKLEAVFKTKCSKCGVMGHLSKNCFQNKEGKSYHLIPEPEPEKKIFGTIEDRLKRLAHAGINEPIVVPHKAKKEKKKRKKRKSYSSSDSDGSPKKKSKRKHRRERKSDSDSEEVPRKKSKRKHEDDDSNSSSDSDEAPMKKSKQKRKKSCDYDYDATPKKKSKRKRKKSESSDSSLSPKVKLKRKHKKEKKHKKHSK